MEVTLRRGEESTIHKAKVKKRAMDSESFLIGTPKNNPLKDTSQYEVEFENSEIEVMAANVIAENIITQVDKEGRLQILIDEIIDHRILDNVVPIEKGTYVTPKGATRKLKTTKGWELFVQWKNGTSN